MEEEDNVVDEKKSVIVKDKPLLKGMRMKLLHPWPVVGRCTASRARDEIGKRENM